MVHIGYLEVPNTVQPFRYVLMLKDPLPSANSMQSQKSQRGVGANAMYIVWLPGGCSIPVSLRAAKREKAKLIFMGKGKLCADTKAAVLKDWR